MEGNEFQIRTIAQRGLSRFFGKSNPPEWEKGSKILLSLEIPAPSMFQRRSLPAKDAGEVIKIEQIGLILAR